MYFIKCNFLILVVLIVKINTEDSNGTQSSTNSGSTLTTVSVPTPAQSTKPNSLSSTTSITVPSVLPTTVPHDTDAPTKSSPVSPSSPTIPPSISTTASTTPAPIITTADPLTTTTGIPHHNRQFDGPSFIGGIILATGLMAIGFVAFKFYKARTERNYHTL